MFREIKISDCRIGYKKFNINSKLSYFFQAIPMDGVGLQLCCGSLQGSASFGAFIADNFDVLGLSKSCGGKSAGVAALGLSH